MMTSDNITYDMLKDFEYLEMVIKESQRTIPILALVLRQLNDEMEIGW